MNHRYSITSYGKTMSLHRVVETLSTTARLCPVRGPLIQPRYGQRWPVWAGPRRFGPTREKMTAERQMLVTAAGPGPGLKMLAVGDDVGPGRQTGPWRMPALIKADAGIRAGPWP